MHREPAMIPQQGSENVTAERDRDGPIEPVGIVHRGFSSRNRHRFWRLLAKLDRRRLMDVSQRPAVVSLTFDDVPESAVSLGAPALERHGVRGTFYVASGMCGQEDGQWRVASLAQVRDLAAAGHEIGCHTSRHVNVQSLGRDELSRECDVNAERLAQACGVARPTNFAYPFGDLGLRQKWILEERFSSCRTIYERLNVGMVDLGLVGAIGLFDRNFDRRRMERLVRDAKLRRAWLVFYTHDVGDAPTGIGTSPRLLDETLTILRDQDVQCLTVAEALAQYRLGGRCT
jgi:peptidoglycan/xylan/chitin deacetylase (PgdA/CDA1 family)